MTSRILLLPGDGIGPEVTAAGKQLLDHLVKKTDLDLVYEDGLIGGAAIDETGSPFPEITRKIAEKADAILLGAVGGPQWAGLTGDKRPEAGLLALRLALGVFANLRPIHVRSEVAHLSPVKREIAEGVDILFVRELTGGLYFGDKGVLEDGAYDTCRYSRLEIERVVRKAADLSRSRRGKITLVDKANVMETSRLWRRVTEDIIHTDYPDLELEILLVDAASMHLITRPRTFDVIVTENLFGDILTDEASVLTGSLGLVPSASIGAGSCGLYEPVHGSAPDIAGQNKANPIGMIESIALMLELSLSRPREAQAVRQAVTRTLAKTRTADMGGTASTQQMTDILLSHLDKCLDFS